MDVVCTVVHLRPGQAQITRTCVRARTRLHARDIRYEVSCMYVRAWTGSDVMWRCRVRNLIKMIMCCYSAIEKMPW